MLTPVSSSVSDYEHNGSSLDVTDRASFTSVTNNSSNISLSLDNEEISMEDDSFVADNAKLKGVLWPGMDIFRLCNARNATQAKSEKRCLCC